MVASSFPGLHLTTECAFLYWIETWTRGSFCNHFSSLSAQMECLGVWKVLTRALTHIFFDVSKSSFGNNKFIAPKRRFWTTEQSVAYAFLNEFSISCIQKLVLTPLKSNFMFPNEDFGRSSKHSGTYFQSTFNIREYSIWDTFILKLLWKFVPECSFDLPKSSFGDHKIISKDFFKLYIAHSVVACSPDHCIIA